MKPEGELTVATTADRRRCRPPRFPSPHPGELYAGWRLSVYDPMAIYAINRGIWRRRSPLIRRLHDRNAGTRHLDIMRGCVALFPATASQ